MVPVESDNNHTTKKEMRMGACLKVHADAGSAFRSASFSGDSYVLCMK